MAAHHPNSDAQSNDQSRNAEHHRNPAAVCSALFHAGVEQHNHEHKQHHDRAGINDDLHRSDKFGPQQQINHRQRSHHNNQRQCAVDRVLLRQEVDCTSDTDRREDEEREPDAT